MHFFAKRSSWVIDGTSKYFAGSLRWAQSLEDIYNFYFSSNFDVGFFSLNWSW
jgi:hypothetical protein